MKNIIANKKLVNLISSVKRILKRNKIKKAGIFGSYARGDYKEKSDIDILIEFDKNKSLLDFIRIKIELEEKLKKKVDLVEYKTIKQIIKKDILNEEVRII